MPFGMPFGRPSGMRCTGSRSPDFSPVPMSLPTSGLPLILVTLTRRLQTEVLEESEGDHSQERMVVESEPGATLEVVESQLLLHLLVRLLAAPPRLDRSQELHSRSRGRMVRHVVLPLTTTARALLRSPLAEEPQLHRSGQVLLVGHGRPIGHAYP